ncbi:hypothetical protein [uncultured Deinococcus sp.]|uniref:hypothetical protein n=1 Tax=uncultured Deinococcus sp. TaxID=158789 RepID=UPI0037481B15
MQNLITPTGLHIAGQWLQPGDRVPGDVVGFDYEKAARKGLIEDTEGDEIENLSLPGQVQAAEPNGGHLDELFGLREDFRREREGRAEDQQRAAQRYASLSEELAQVRTQAQQTDVAHAQALEQAKAEHETALTVLREEHTRALEEVKANVLPEDALKRITDVKGVGDKLAPTILAALKAPVASAPAPDQG